MKRAASASDLFAAGALALAATLGLGSAAHAQARTDLVARTSLRVCADPANMPFSNEAGEGFENKIAEIVADELKLPVEYVWFPQATGFVRNTLGAKRCDLVMGFAQGDELVQNTNPYFRSAYVLIIAPGRGLDGVDSLTDPRLKGHRIGVVAGSPPASILAEAGLLANAKPYPLVVDRRYESPAELMIADIRSGEIDAGILWGPIGGYFATRGEPKLEVVPLVREKSGPRMTYRITFGIRPFEENWKHRLNEIIAKRQGDIDTILLSYGVPLLDEQDRLIAAPRK